MMSLMRTYFSLPYSWIEQEYLDQPVFKPPIICG